MITDVGAAVGKGALLTLFLLLSSGGCGPAPEQAEDAPPSGEDPVEPGPGGAGSWVELPDGGQPPGGTGSYLVRERGVGVAYLPPDPWDAEDADDTLFVRAAPDPSAAPAALFVRDSLFGFHLLVPPERAGATSLALEFGYEELGLPGDAPPRQDGWTPVLYALDGADTLEGWVRIEPGEAEWIGWEEQLRGLPVFFAVPADSVRFRAEPEGEDVRIPLGTDYGRDYILHPLEARGPWLRVEVVRPSDYCAEPLDPARDTAWVRYLDDDGRPRLWYFTRGC